LDAGLVQILALAVFRSQGTSYLRTPFNERIPDSLATPTHSLLLVGSIWKPMDKSLDRFVYTLLAAPSATSEWHASKGPRQKQRNNTLIQRRIMGSTLAPKQPIKLFIAHGS
jgi:hypothetical protein